jgi:uncharacterized membrane protein
VRTTWDRIRHTTCFEILGLLIFAPVATWAFGYEIHQMGVIGVVASVIAACWNYVYNIGFDRTMIKITGRVQKSPVVRVLHAFVFECGLLIVFLPMVAWYLDISLLEALWMDIAVAAFYMGYAFVYNWAYDTIFPIPAHPHANLNRRDASSEAA